MINVEDTVAQYNTVVQKSTTTSVKSPIEFYFTLFSLGVLCFWGNLYETSTLKVMLHIVEDGKRSKYNNVN